MNFSLGKIVPAFLLFGCTAVAEILGCFFSLLNFKAREIRVVRLLFSLLNFKAREIRVVMGSCDLEFGDICLAINTTSRRFWADLCRLWGHLYFYGLTLVTFC